MTVLNFERPGTVKVVEWTARHATALCAAKRMTGEEFAEHLGFSRRCVFNWRAKPDTVVSLEAQRALDTVHGLLSDDERRRFQLALDDLAHDQEETLPSGGCAGYVGLTFGSSGPRIIIDFGDERRLALGSPEEAEQVARTILTLAAAARAGETA